MSYPGIVYFESELHRLYTYDSLTGIVPSGNALISGFLLGSPLSGIHTRNKWNNELSHRYFSATTSGFTGNAFI